MEKKGFKIILISSLKGFMGPFLPPTIGVTGKSLGSWAHTLCSVVRLLLLFNSFYEPLAIHKNYLLKGNISYK